MEYSTPNLPIFSAAFREFRRTARALAAQGPYKPLLGYTTRRWVRFPLSPLSLPLGLHKPPHGLGNRLRTIPALLAG